MAAPSRALTRLSPLRFILVFGAVSMLGDIVYEGARSVTGPFLGTLGASALVVGVVTGLGEAIAYVLRLVSGPLSDRTRRYWALAIAGYAITVVAVPLLAIAGQLWLAALLVVAERFGKAVRSPAKDTMLAQASVSIGRGRAFALHEALDQVGAFAGPLLVALGVWLSHGYRIGFAVLAVPGVALLVVLGYLRRRVPDPARYESAHRESSRVDAAAPTGRLPARFWHYTAFTALTMLGFATFGVLGFHMQARHLLPASVVPLVYSVAMAVDAVAALASGWAYDRYGLRGLVVIPLLTGAIPWLSFSTQVGLVWAGAVLWGLSMGIQESTLRAAVADLVPASRRGTGYGVFSAAYGLAWLAGSALIGALYGHSVALVGIAVGVAETAALVVFLTLLRRGGRARPVPGDADPVSRE